MNKKPFKNLMTVLLHCIGLASFVFFFSSPLQSMEQPPFEHKSLSKEVIGLIESVDPNNFLASLPALKDLIKNNPEALEYLHDTIHPQWERKYSYTANKQMLHLVGNGKIVAFIFRNAPREFGYGTTDKLKIISETIPGNTPFRCIAITPDDQYIIATSDADVAIYNINMRLWRQTISRISLTRVTALAAFSEKRIAVADSQGSIDIVNPYTNPYEEPLNRIRNNHSSEITALTWLSENSLISFDKQGRLVIHFFSNGRFKEIDLKTVFKTQLNYNEFGIFDEIRCYKKYNLITVQSKENQKKCIFITTKDMGEEGIVVDMAMIVPYILSHITDNGTIVLYSSGMFRYINKDALFDKKNFNLDMHTITDLDKHTPKKPFLQTSQGLVSTHMIQQFPDGCIIFKKLTPNKKELLLKIAFKKALSHNDVETMKKLCNNKLFTRSYPRFSEYIPEKES